MTVSNAQEYLENELLDVESSIEDSKMWFLRLKETLTRIGVPRFSKVDRNTLFQSVYVLRKGDSYYLPHFKEMFILDSRSNNMTDDDIVRRNTIAVMLENWGALKLTERSKAIIMKATPDIFDNFNEYASRIFILSYSKKHNWDLVQKYPIGIIQNQQYHQRKY